MLFILPAAVHLPAMVATLRSKVVFQLGYIGPLLRIGDPVTQPFPKIAAGTYTKNCASFLLLWVTAGTAKLYTAAMQ